jgi:hypothetical protein
VAASALFLGALASTTTVMLLAPRLPRSALYVAATLIVLALAVAIATAEAPSRRGADIGR